MNNSTVEVQWATYYPPIYNHNIRLYRYRLTILINKNDEDSSRSHKWPDKESDGYIWHYVVDIKMITFGDKINPDTHIW